MSTPTRVALAVLCIFAVVAVGQIVRAQTDPMTLQQAVLYTGADLGVRVMQPTYGGTPVATIVVRVAGRWQEVDVRPAGSTTVSESAPSDRLLESANPNAGGRSSLAVLPRTGTRPSLAGQWNLVIEKSTPPPARHNQELTITQDPRTIALAEHSTLTVLPIGRPAGAAKLETLELHSAATYEFDGGEHPDAAHGPSADSTYRAVWTRDQLVIITRTTRTTTPANAAPFSSTSVERKALSIDAEGQLVVDTITISDPVPDGPTQRSPTPSRGVYRKAS